MSSLPLLFASPIAGPGIFPPSIGSFTTTFDKAVWPVFFTVKL